VFCGGERHVQDEHAILGKLRRGGRWKLMGTVFDSIVEGGVLLGGAGFAAHLALKWRSDARRFGQYVLPGLVVALAQHGMPVIRVRILL